MDNASLPESLDALASDPAARQEYARLWTLLHQADAEADAAYDVDAAWTDLADDLDLPASSHTKPTQDASARTPASASDPVPVPASARRTRRPAASGASHRRRIGPALRRGLAAAVLAAVLVAGGLLWRTSSVTVATAPGEQTTVTLPDGSSVTLNGDASLSHPRAFALLPGGAASARRVSLRGEAYFDVAHGTAPFSVETPNATVEVLGTTFAVATHPGDEGATTAVTVTSGRVRVAGGGQAVTLDRPGAQTHVDGPAGTPAAPETIDPRYVTAWRTGGFAVENASLPALARRLERRFGTRIHLRLPEPAAYPPLTMHYATADRPEAVLQDVCTLHGLAFHKTADGFAVVPKTDE